MIAEKSNTAQRIIGQVSGSAGKVSFIDTDVLSRAIIKLEQDGIPNSRNEDYKYCNVESFFRKEFRELAQDFNETADIDPYKLGDTITLVVLNGRFVPELSDKVVLQGLRITSLAGQPAGTVGSVADPRKDAFIALNTAFSGGGISVTIESGVSLQIPIHILFIQSAKTASLVNARSFITVGPGASATVTEHFINAGQANVFCNFLGEKKVGEGGRLESYLMQEEGSRGYGVYTNQVHAAAGSVYDNTTITLSGQLVRNNHNVVLAGTNVQAHLYGLFSSRENQLVDNHTLVDHQMPHCESNELYKGIVNDKSTGVFNGKIYVRQDAQKTNAYQSSKNILLSDDATVNTKPQLEIYANDVKCSHGTSTGKIDENALFYLNSRGIGKETAKRLLLSSFAAEVLDRIGVESLKERAVAGFESGLQQ